MRKIIIVSVACLLLGLMTLVPYAGAQPAQITVTAEVLPDINNTIGLGFTSDWNGSSLDPTTQEGWSETSSAENPWALGFIVPDSTAYTENGTTNTSLDRYFWIWRYQSNTYSGVTTVLADVSGQESFYDALSDSASFYKWSGSEISTTPLGPPIPDTDTSKPIHPSYTSVWTWPTKLHLDIADDWSIEAGEYWAKVTNQWFYSDEAGNVGSADDRGPIERYFKVAVDKALSDSVGLVFGTTWGGGQISGSGSPFVVDDSDCSDGVSYTFYGGLSDFQSNTVTYNRLTIGPAKQASDGLDKVTDLRRYVSQYFWTGSGFAPTGTPTYPSAGGDYVVDSTLQPQPTSCTVPNKFVVDIPVADVFKVGAGRYTAVVKSEWSFDAPNGAFGPIDGATAQSNVSVDVPRFYDGYELPTGDQSFSSAVKPGVPATYQLTIEGYQNHDRQVTVATTVGTGLDASDVSLAAGTLQHATGTLSGLSWTGTFEFNNAGEASELPLTWTFTPDWAYEPGKYAMTVTLTHTAKS